MRVGFEALAWGRHINDYRQAWEAVRHAGHEHVGLILDSFHMLARRLPVDDIGQTADAPGIEMDLLFLSRHYRCFPGQGDLPVAAMMRKLDEIDYQGPISHEIFSDDFRASSTRRVASDGMRSFLWLDEQVGGRAAAALPAIDGVEFIEFVDDPNQVGVHALQPITRQLAETKAVRRYPIIRRYPIRKVTTPVPVEGGVANGGLPMSAGTSFHGRRKPNGSACQRRTMAGVQDEAKDAISAMSPLKSAVDGAGVLELSASRGTNLVRRGRDPHRRRRRAVAFEWRAQAS